MGATPGIPPPDDAYVLGSAFGQDIANDPSLGKTALAGDVLDSWTAAQEKAHEAYNDPLDALRADLDLLTGVPAYGAVYQSSNIWVVNNNPILPFNSQIGPAKRVTVIGAGSTTDGKLRGVDYGLWMVNSLIFGSSTPYTGNGRMRMDICVDIYNGATLMMNYLQSVTADADPDGSVSNSMMFVVPEGLTHFHVYIKAFSTAWRQFMGGIRYSSLSLLRISEDVAHATPAATVPDGNSAP